MRRRAFEIVLWRHNDCVYRLPLYMVGTSYVKNRSPNRVPLAFVQVKLDVIIVGSFSA